MKLFITGCGSLATAYTKEMIGKYEKIIIYSRDWQKQEKLKNEIDPDLRYKLRFFIGDIRDLQRLKLATKEVDIILHTAAIKNLDTCEYNCLETVKTNIISTQNVIEAAIENNVIKTIFISSDKAVNPINSYGISKGMGEKLIINANYLSAGKQKFAYLRYGNVANSSGSVIPRYKELLKDNNFLPLTHLDCTRFWFDMKDAIKLINDGFMDNNDLNMPIIPKKMKSFYVRDLISAFNAKHFLIGLRKNEKIHEEIEPGKSSENGEFMSVKEIKEKLIELRVL